MPVWSPVLQPGTSLWRVRGHFGFGLIRGNCPPATRAACADRDQGVRRTGVPTHPGAVQAHRRRLKAAPAPALAPRENPPTRSSPGALHQN